MADAPNRLTDALEGRYEIERELGAGGMATVYLARDLKHHRHVAIKVFRPELAELLGGGRFLREIEIVAQIEHPHILTLIDSGDAEGLLYFVMPYVSGESLRARLTKEEKLPVGDVIRLLRDVADGLAEAHRHGLVHRDIKPDNVMMSGNHAVVMDFGVAKAVTSVTGEHPVTTAGITLGTPTYMSPEQAAADPNIDHRTDIYALGVLAYELLTGRPPLSGASAAQILAAHLSIEPDPVSRHREETPPALEAVVMKCLEKDPTDRWQQTEEVVRQLEAIATPSGGVPSMRMSAARAARRSRWSRGKIAAAVAVVVAATALVVFQQRRAAATRALVAELQAAVDVEDLDRVYSLLLESGRSLGERALAPIASTAGGGVSLTTDPPGAGIRLERVSAALDSVLPALDVAPGPTGEIPLVAGEYRATVTGAGYVTAEVAFSMGVGETASVHRTLVPETWDAGDMVFVDPGPVPGPLAREYDGVEVPAFLIDRLEVSNRRFMEFVVDGGYRDATLWPDSMYVDGDWVSRGEAIAGFVDRTGLPGPRGWTGGTFREGRADHPVTGVSWYEASAFAAWSGKSLPTFEQWWRAALGESGSRFPWGDDLRSIDERSNFGAVGTTPVGSFAFGVSPFGVHDMAGNVREWLAGAITDTLIVVLGGSWQTPTYMFDTPNLESFAPSFESEEVGLRLVAPVPSR
jgi:formylglycine-generating enzyme required for sulfatase activity/tRNA A-37 threonylcarbamoyl transferase component Bud32